MRKQPKPTTLPLIVSESLWTIENLAAYMQIAVATIYSDLTRAPTVSPRPCPAAVAPVYAGIQSKPALGSAARMAKARAASR